MTVLLIRFKASLVSFSSYQRKNTGLSRRKYAGNLAAKVVGLGGLCISRVFCMLSCFCFVQLHIFCRLQLYQLLNYVNFLKTCLDVNENEINSLIFHYEDKTVDPIKCKSKQFYELQISKKAMLSRGFIKLKEEFGLDDVTISKVFLNFKSVASETFVRSFQFKLLDDITYTNMHLAKIGYVSHDSCTF